MVVVVGLLNVVEIGTVVVDFTVVVVVLMGYIHQELARLTFKNRVWG